MGDWWTVAEDREIRRGQLLWTHIPFVGWLPYELVPENRTTATDHSRALFRLGQKRQGAASESTLPIAALPLNPGETFSVYRAKWRPVLVVNTGGVTVEPELTQGAAKWQSARTYQVAPYFGADTSRQRGGWKLEFIQKIRHCQYPQYFWDQLPGGEPSILRLDQMQPVGAHHQAFKYTPHRLSEGAVEVLEQWLMWYFFDQLDPDGVVHMAREELPTFR